MKMNNEMHMMMPMTFTSFTDYKLKLLFDSWDIQTKWQFFLSWLTVCLMTIFYHFVKYLIICLEDICTKKYGASSDDVRVADLFKRLIPEGNGASDRAMMRCVYRLIHSTLVALNYGLALMLMLVGMTFNPMLFLALVIGYGIGDFIFFIPTISIFSDLSCH
mmetsp:Transcript_36055/g.36742  ORF Transcript_36055/g.36742 Transcript_36055/m.36742 type:complete len:162 (-) Transcript_36055:210-695(-)